MKSLHHTPLCITQHGFFSLYQLLVTNWQTIGLFLFCRVLVDTCNSLFLSKKKLLIIKFLTCNANSGQSGGKGWGGEEMVYTLGTDSREGGKVERGEALNTAG